jgi:TRAP-type uncharacterized transport system substrate-binding protein
MPTLIYEITKALWNEATPASCWMAAGHAKGKAITRENAVKGAGIPFHPGAERFYKEAGPDQVTPSPRLIRRAARLPCFALRH